MSELIFRKATPADVPSLRELVRSAYYSPQGWTTEAGLIFVDDRIDAQGMLAKIQEPNGQVLVALSPPTELLGCCELVRLPAPSNAAYLGLFSVRPALQNGGIGRRLLAEAERVAREEMGVEVMEMQVLWMREELIAYYERRGYSVVEGETRPFPYEQLMNAREGTRSDLYFVVLKKTLV